MPNFVVKFEEKVSVKLVQNDAGLKACSVSTPGKPASNRVKSKPSKTEQKQAERRNLFQCEY